MGIFGQTNAIAAEVDLATSENNAEENWGQIINICDKAGKSTDEAKAYLKAIRARLFNSDPHIALHAVTLLDACIKNCGKTFHIEVASRDFETDFNKLMTKSHQKVAKKLRESLKKWAENEFKTDQQLNLIPSLYAKLKGAGLDFASSDMPVKKAAPVSKDPNVVESQEEEEQILKAIELSLKETTTGSPRSSNSASLYPSTSLAGTASASANSNSAPAKEPKKVRALYDFEAAEDNELTFSSGEIIFVIDDSDPNWWKGSNQRGEGLFPANFVTKDLTVEPEKFLYEKAKKIVQFKETVDVKVVEKELEEVEINETKIDRLLHLLHEADPTNPETDTDEMLKLEREVNGMGPLIDSELERVDRKHAQLTQLSADLVEALGLYHTLMREPQFPPVGKMPYNYGHQMPPNSLSYNGSGLPPPPGMPPMMQQGVPAPMPSGHMPPMHYPPQVSMAPGMMPPSQGLPQGLPPHMMQSQVPDDRRYDPSLGHAPPGMINYGAPLGMMPPGYPGVPLSNSGHAAMNNGPPQAQSQHYMGANNNQK